MKTIFCLVLGLAFAGANAQSIVGTWQQTEKKTCFESTLPQSETEKELVPLMGSNSQMSVARLIKFDSKDRGEEGIFSEGSKKGDGMNPFKYRIVGQELQILDKKSGIMKQQFIIDELSETTLKIHDARKDCETRTFARIK